MNTITRSLLLALFIFSPAAAISEDSATVTSPEPVASEPPVRTACATQCDSAETMCSSEVRRARQQCSKLAATPGGDPFTAHSNDYGYFCGYFGNPAQCGSYADGSSCRSRFARTYGLCIDAMQQNIASKRYDCQQTERTAQTYCRDELRACKAACQ